MKYYTNKYPSFDEIKDELTREDLIDIVEAIIELNLPKINSFIEDYIVDNFEPIMVRDVDREKDEQIDEEMKNES